MLRNPLLLATPVCVPLSFLRQWCGAPEQDRWAIMRKPLLIAIGCVLGFGLMYSQIAGCTSYTPHPSPPKEATNVHKEIGGSDLLLQRGSRSLPQSSRPFLGCAGGSNTLVSLYENRTGDYVEAQGDGNHR